MTKKRMLVGGAALALTLGLGGGIGAGIAAAQTDPTPPARPPAAGTMHDGDMDTMHAQMPDEMRAQCDAMHAEGGAMTDGGMMNGPMGGGMMGDRMTSQS